MGKAWIYHDNAASRAAKNIDNYRLRIQQRSWDTQKSVEDTKIQEITDTMSQVTGYTLPTLDEVHRGFHAFIYGGETLSVEIDMRPFAWMNGRVIRVNVVDIVIEMEFCPAADQLWDCQNLKIKEGRGAKG
jgi:hypothetical protein